MDFTKVVEALDAAKMLYYKLFYADDHKSEVRPTLSTYAHEMKKEVEDTFVFIVNEMKSDTRYPVWEAALEGIKMIALSVAPREHWKDIEEGLTELSDYDSDYPFYNRGGFGKYWNEVALPYFIDNFFKVYVDSILAPHVPGMIGVEKATVPNGAWAISYYDLSDIAIVFEDEKSADKFADNNPVDPS